MITLMKKNNRTPSLFNNFFDDDFGIIGFDGFKINNKFNNNFNIIDNKDSYIYEFFYPGLKKDNFNIFIENDFLNICFDYEKNTKEEKDYIYEGYIKNHQIQRVLLRDDISVEDIESEYVDGVLRIIFKKNNENKSLKTTIKIK